MKKEILSVEGQDPKYETREISKKKLGEFIIGLMNGQERLKM